MPEDGTKVITCEGCGLKVPATGNPEFCPGCGASFTEAPPPDPAETGDSADDVLKSVDAFLSGVDAQTPPPMDAPGPGPAGPRSSPKDPQLSLPGRKPGKRGPGTKKMEDYLREAQREENDHKVRRITVVERKTRKSTHRIDGDKLVCNNCHQIYDTLHVQKCMTCGSSYLKRISAEPLPLPDSPFPEPEQLESPPEETAVEGEPPAEKTKPTFRYYAEGAHAPSGGGPGKGQTLDVSDAEGGHQGTRSLEDMIDDGFPGEQASEKDWSQLGEAESAKGWGAALQEEPFHKKRALSSFSHEYFLNKQVGGYVIKDVLGRGGMGTVFRAVHLKDEKDVALKVLPPIFATDEGKVERFTKEAKSSMKLDHPNIVTCYDVGQEGDIHFIAMELVLGKSVGDLIKDKRALKIEESLRIIREAATGLGVAHEKGMIHRDIKPDNIMITEDGRIMVADFGLARDTEASSSLSNTGEIVGTPYYISPEQIDCLEVDPRADIYSLGATIYHLITGKHPFQGETPMEVLLKHMNEKLIPPVDRNPLIPNSVSRLIEKMMEKNRDFRYGAIQTLVRDIETIERGGVPQITLEAEKAPKTPKKKRKPVVKPPRSRLLTGTVAVVIIVAAAVAARFWGLPGVDTSPVLAEAKPFDPATSAVTEVLRYAKDNPDQPLEVIRRAESVLTSFPKSSRAGEVRSAKAGAEKALAQASVRWYETLLAQSSVQHKAGKLGAAIRLLSASPRGLSLTPAQETELARRKSTLVQELSEREKMAFVPTGKVTLKTAEGADIVVAVHAYFLANTEVSNRAYKKYVDAKKARAPWKGGSFPEDRAEFPVTGVTFDEAQAYAAWAGARLPTEAEWVRAARGDGGLPYPWGQHFDPRRCNFRGAHVGDAVAVGSYRDGASPFGVRNMSGNVSEWTRTPYPGRSTMRVVRGGSYLSSAATTRADTRFGAKSDYAHESLGFRLARDFEEK